MTARRSTGVEQAGQTPIAATTVALLGGREARPLAVLRELGCRVVYVADSVPWELLPLIDVPVEAHLEDWEEVAARLEAEARRTPIEAVITHTEPWVPLMAYLNRRLNGAPHGLDLEAAWNCRDKLRMRRRLQAGGSPPVRFVHANSAAEAAAAAPGIGLPVVVKPRDGAGGFGVRLCRTRAEVQHAAGHVLERAAAGSWLPGVLVEEYLEGVELAVQTITWKGQTEVVSVFEELVSAGPVFVELGYDYPPALAPQQHLELEQAVSVALTALGVDNWLSHTQVRRTSRGFQVVEVNARRPGGRLVSMTEAVTGVDLLAAATLMALGRRPSRTAPRARHALYRSIVFGESGRLAYEPEPEWHGLESGLAPIVELDVAPGERVFPLEHPDGGVFGRIVVFGESREAVERDYDRIRRQLALSVVSDTGPHATGHVTADVAPAGEDEPLPCSADGSGSIPRYAFAGGCP